MQGCVTIVILREKEGPVPSADLAGRLQEILVIAIASDCV
jgi:hypothetical protein